MFTVTKAIIMWTIRVYLRAKFMYTKAQLIKIIFLSCYELAGEEFLLL
jgi:hypothetical protein